MNPLLQYLNHNGILLCNANPELPAMEDIGCTWSDVTELIDRRELFYCKAFRKRTTYLSKETYYLLKEVRQKKPLTPAAQKIYSISEDGAGVAGRYFSLAGKVAKVPSRGHSPLRIPESICLLAQRGTPILLTVPIRTRRYLSSAHGF